MHATKIKNPQDPAGKNDKTKKAKKKKKTVRAASGRNMGTNVKKR